MKVAKWKVLTVAGALVLGYAVSSQAVQLKVDEDTFADFGFWTKIRYTYQDELTKNGYEKNEFNVKDARFNIEGQVNKLVQFYGEFVADSAVPGENGAKLEEAGINFAFIPEFQVRLTKGRIPFTRAQAANDYALLDQLGPWYDPQDILKGNSVLYSGKDAGPLKLLRKSDGGAVVHGVVANGMLKYSVGIFDTLNREKQLRDVMWAGRVEFSPPIAGFNAEPVDPIKGWVNDSYLGKKGDILTIGLGFYSETNADNIYWNGTAWTTSTNYGKDLDTTGWTVDAFLEKKFGCSVLNLEGGYINLNDSHFYYDAANNTKRGDTTIWYGQGQLFYDQVVGIGKPALYVRYENISADGPDDDYDVQTWGVGVNYYIEGNAARLSAGFKNVNYDDDASDYLGSNGEDNITDWFVQAQIMF